MKAPVGGKSAAAAETERDRRIRQLERTPVRKLLETEILKNVVGKCAGSLPGASLGRRGLHSGAWVAEAGSEGSTTTASLCASSLTYCPLGQVQSRSILPLGTGSRLILDIEGFEARRKRERESSRRYTASFGKVAVDATTARLPSPFLSAQASLAFSVPRLPAKGRVAKPVAAVM